MSWMCCLANFYPKPEPLDYFSTGILDVRKSAVEKQHLGPVAVVLAF